MAKKVLREDRYDTVKVVLYSISATDWAHPSWYTVQVFKRGAEVDSKARIKTISRAESVYREKCRKAQQGDYTKKKGK